MQLDVPIDYDRLQAPAEVAQLDAAILIARSRCQRIRKGQLAGLAIALLAPGWWKLGGLFVYWM